MNITSFWRKRKFTQNNLQKKRKSGKLKERKEKR